MLSDSGLYDIVPYKIKLQILKQQFTREVALIDILRRSSFAFTAILLEGFMPVQVEGGEIIYESGMPWPLVASTRAYINSYIHTCTHILSFSYTYMYGYVDTITYLSCISFLHHTLRMHTTPPPLIPHHRRRRGR